MANVNTDTCRYTEGQHVTVSTDKGDFEVIIAEGSGDDRHVVIRFPNAVKKINVEAGDIIRIPEIYLCRDDWASEQPIVIDMRIHGAAVQRITMIHALALEISTGMQMSRNANPLAVAKRLGFTGHTKKAALKWAVELHQSEDPSWVPASSVTRALGK